MSDLLAHALAVAHAARRGRDDGGPVEGFDAPLTDDDRNVADASRTAPFMYDDFGRPISAPVSGQSFAATKPIGKGDAFFNALDVADRGEAYRPADSYGMYARGSLEAGPAPTQLDLARDLIAPHGSTMERSNFASGMQSLAQFTPPGIVSDALDAANRGHWGEAAINAAGFLPAGKLAMAAGLPMAARRAAEEAGSAAVDKALDVARKAGPKRGDLARSTELPDLHTMPADQAVAVARREPHLIQAGDQSEGYFVGSPREIQSKRGLTNQRNRFDEYVAADPRGGDWYDRYRNSINEVTGGNPVDNDWMTKMHGQWSAGVSPEGELGFALKENNGALAGMPVKSARPAQHEAFMRAIQANDPNELQLGDKTGMYAQKITPDQALPPGATGVNDFRYARQWGYTEANGDPQRDALTQAQHRFMDYETALAVDRANRANLGGRNDWTGESLQAALWVRQKALAILEQRPAILEAHLKAGASPEDAARLAYEDAFNEANKQTGDFFGKHTAFATHEAFPGSETGHLPGSLGASPEERAAYAADPRSTWANAPGNRDAIYGGMRLGDTGVSMRTRPTLDMQGRYVTPAGDTEYNPGWTARPLVAFDSGKVKTTAPADQALLNAGEATRGYIDAQNASAWHKPWMGGAPGESNSYFMPMPGKASPEALDALHAAGAQHGLGDVVDTGQGITMTSFYPPPPARSGKDRDVVERALGLVAPKGATKLQRAKVDSGYIDYSDKWREGVGSGAATRELLNHVEATPEIKASLNNNPYIAQNALDRLERDEAYAAKWGATRQDIQNARRIIGEGPGWIDRLKEGLTKGTILPAIGVPVLAPALSQQEPPASRG